MQNFNEPSKSNHQLHIHSFNENISKTFLELLGSSFFYIFYPKHCTNLVEISHKLYTWKPTFKCKDRKMKSQVLYSI